MFAGVTCGALGGAAQLRGTEQERSIFFGYTLWSGGERRASACQVFVSLTRRINPGAGLFLPSRVQVSPQLLSVLSFQFPELRGFPARTPARKHKERRTERNTTAAANHRPKTEATDNMAHQEIRRPQGTFDNPHSLACNLGDIYLRYVN